MIHRCKMQMESDGNASYCRLDVATREDRWLLNESFKGLPVDLASWKPLKVQRSPSEKVNLERPLGDRCGIDYKLDPMVLSRRALDTLIPHIASCGQVLPLDFADCEYHLFNITHVIDALDLEACEKILYPDGGLSRVLRHVFKPEAVRDERIFKVPQLRGNFSFVKERFVKLVKEAELTGFGFEAVWSNGHPAAK